MFSILFIGQCEQQAGNETEKTMKFNTLTSEEERVIVNKGTEPPFSGEYVDFVGIGTYVCRRCNAPLYRSADKFSSQCGWPSFDDEIPGAVKRVPDPDGSRTEIICAFCGGHLGHVFRGENLTSKDTRHCVNSLSIKFVPDAGITNPEHSASATVSTVSSPEPMKAWFSGGCFWGMEYHFQNIPGVIGTRVGYMGGHGEKPTYEEVCSHSTGHLETLEVTYDPHLVSYEDLAKLFFEIHDPTQSDGQGPDIGEQYLSAIFTSDKAQLEIIGKLIGILRGKGLNVVTQIRPQTTFWPAEEYHQHYYAKNGKQPYCHIRVRRF
ncbi:MAG: bifunctional methionine sulfoxide reductase B/A protein [Candidatus Riflebacteria bacterium]|nr:bifunctional methionine sulfoxide reductase B/A protein [Candidatus Riflebacteria bacterium]